MEVIPEEFIETKDFSEEAEFDENRINENDKILKNINEKDEEKRRDSDIYLKEKMTTLKHYDKDKTLLNKR